MLGVGAQGTHRIDMAPNLGGSQFSPTELQAQSFPGLWAPCSPGQHREACATFPTHLCNVLHRCLTLVIALHHSPGLLRVCVLWGSWTQPLRTDPLYTASQPCTSMAVPGPCTALAGCHRLHLCIVFLCCISILPAVVLPLKSLQLSSVLCHSLGPHCCIGLGDSPRIWAWLLAMHHCAVPTDGMPPQHCISASRGMSACSWPGPAHCATALGCCSLWNFVLSWSHH